MPCRPGSAWPNRKSSGYRRRMAGSMWSMKGRCRRQRPFVVMTPVVGAWGGKQETARTAVDPDRGEGIKKGPSGWAVLEGTGCGGAVLSLRGQKNVDNMLFVVTCRTNIDHCLDKAMVRPLIIQFDTLLGLGVQAGSGDIPSRRPGGPWPVPRDSRCSPTAKSAGISGMAHLIFILGQPAGTHGQTTGRRRLSLSGRGAPFRPQRSSGAGNKGT